MAEPTINDVPRVGLEIHQNADLSFSVEWWMDKEATVPQNLSGAEGVVRGGGEVHDLAAFISVNGNAATLFVPRETFADWTPFDRGQWDFLLIATTGEVKKVARGPARYHEDLV